MFESRNICDLGLLQNARTHGPRGTVKTIEKPILQRTQVHYFCSRNSLQDTNATKSTDGPQQRSCPGPLLQPVSSPYWVQSEKEWQIMEKCYEARATFKWHCHEISGTSTAQASGQTRSRDNHGINTRKNLEQQVVSPPGLSEDIWRLVWITV